MLSPSFCEHILQISQMRKTSLHLHFLTSWQKVWKSIHVFKLSGSSFHSLTAVNEKADYAKAELLFGILHSPQAVDLEARALSKGIQNLSLVEVQYCSTCYVY